MKIKLLTQEPLHIAGVVHYGSLKDSDGRESRSIHIHIDDDEFKDDVEKIKKNAYKIKEQVMEDLRRNKQHMKQEYKEHKKAWKSDFTKPDDDQEPQEKEDYVYNLDGAIKKFGDVMESVGRHIEKNAKNWEENIRDWSQNFEVKMDDFGGMMDAWGEDFEKKMEAWGKDFEKRWDQDEPENRYSAIKRHPIYRTYKDIFDKYLVHSQGIVNNTNFYEVQILDTSYDEIHTMTMLGNKMTSIEDVRFPVATMTFAPDKWVAVKLSQEEFEQDFIGRLESVDVLSGYEIEPYYIVKHKWDGSNDKIKVFVPLKDKAYEG